MAGNTPLVTAITAAVTTDTELAEEARSLAHKAIRIANDYLDNGSPRMQLDVIKSIMPAVGRGLTDKGESEELAEMRATLAEVMSLVRGDEPAA